MMAVYVSVNTLGKGLEKAGVNGRVSTHAFRHTAAAHFLTEGVPMRHVQEFLGHSMISTTDRYYGHLVANALDELPAALLRRA